jgi:hypothetical protein
MDDRRPGAHVRLGLPVVPDLVARADSLRHSAYNNGTTHVIFEPLDFIAKLVALVPKSRVNLTCYHGVFAPNSKYRIQVPDIYQ